MSHCGKTTCENTHCDGITTCSPVLFRYICRNAFRRSIEELRRKHKRIPRKFDAQVHVLCGEFDLVATVETDRNNVVDDLGCELFDAYRELRTVTPNLPPLDEMFMSEHAVIYEYFVQTCTTSLVMSDTF